MMELISSKLKDPLLEPDAKYPTNLELLGFQGFSGSLVALVRRDNDINKINAF